MTTDVKYVYLLTLLYFIASLTGILHHELWLDESHHWLLARDSVSLLDLIKNTRYEGHPVLWNALLYIISRFTLNPLWMQVLHIVISTSAVFLFLRKAPFPWIFKTLFIFGYFMIFEYNLISRNYILGVLFLFLACSVFKKRSRKFMLLSLYLALAANTHLIFSVVAFALYVTVIDELIKNKQIFRRPSYILGCLIFIFGIVLAVIQIIPPHDTQFFNHVHEMALHERFTKGFISLFKGLIIIPDFTSMHFWNSNLLVNWSKPVAAVLGLLVYTIPLFLFKSRRTLFFAYTALLGAQVFFFITLQSATRFDGMAFIIIIVGLWIDHFQHRKESENALLIKLNLFKNPVIYSILAIHFFSGIYAYAMDYRYPFTTAKATFDYLEKNYLNTREIVSVTCDGTLISPYLEKKVWFLCDGGYQSFCHWNTSCQNISKKAIIENISVYMRNHNNAIYVSNYSIVDNPQTFYWIIVNNNVKVRFLKKFNSGIVRNTTTYIYEISKTNANLP